MSNSPLVNYTRISPNKNSPRNHKIDTITIHCVVGQCSVETLGNIFAPTSRQASSNYGIGFDGKIGMYVEEKDRSWCSSSASNDNRAITIEVASDTKHPYAVNEKAFAALLDLVTDICKRNGIKRLVWSTNKKADEGGRVLRREEGEALFTDYGVSGIAAMQLSRALGGMRNCTLAIDFLPEMSEADTAAMLLSRMQGMSPRSCEGFLAGTLNRMLNMCVLRAAGVAPAKPCSELSRDEVNALAKCLKHFNVNVLGGQDFKNAQVMRGGAALDGFDLPRLSVHRHKRYRQDHLRQNSGQGRQL